MGDDSLKNKYTRYPTLESPGDMSRSNSGLEHTEASTSDPGYYQLGGHSNRLRNINDTGTRIPRENDFPPLYSEPNTFVPMAAGEFLRHEDSASEHSYPITNAAPRERGSQVMSDKILESSVSSRDDRYNDSVLNNNIPYREYGGTAAGLGLAAGNAHPGPLASIAHQPSRSRYAFDESSPLSILAIVCSQAPRQAPFHDGTRPNVVNNTSGNEPNTRKRKAWVGMSYLILLL